ncbi:MAG: BON domain-containing protein [Acidobacteria bacterium]|nr:BON domain-containing protein [Acidobacteriota bacterium]MCA1612145.1 BON domain-containing protein [Acidobacteriota bacterium]MCA1617394.1 BON domain-containing protein [Acidobacteriota bacterium]
MVSRRTSQPIGRAARAAGAALLAATLGVGCASSAHNASTAADRELSRRANEALAQAGLDTHRLEARSYRGVVALLGQGQDGEAQEAQRAVLSVPGVVRVNNLVLSRGSSTSSGFSRAKGAPIIARVETAQQAKEE